MSTYPNDRLESGVPQQARPPLRKRSAPVPNMRGRRTSDRRFAVPRALALTQTLWIQEAIARYVAENPTQLYRGGA